jgi:hypothetical protein
MATTFNHASQDFDATQEKSIEHMNEKSGKSFSHLIQTWILTQMMIGVMP